MSAWISSEQRLVTFPDLPVEGHPDWIQRDCHCCMGLTWTYGTECPDCAGAGSFFVHRPSRRIAQYPGGPFLGRLGKGEAA